MNNVGVKNADPHPTEQSKIRASQRPSWHFVSGILRPQIQPNAGCVGLKQYLLKKYVYK